MWPTRFSLIEQVAIPEVKDRNEIFAHTRASAEKAGSIIYLISRGMKSMFSDDSARVGTYDTFYGYGTVGTVGTVRWVRWVRYGVYGGYGTVGTVGTVQWVRYGGYGGTVRWVRWVRYGGYSGYGTRRLSEALVQFQEQLRRSMTRGAGHLTAPWTLQPAEAADVLKILDSIPDYEHLRDFSCMTEQEAAFVLEAFRKKKGITGDDVNMGDDAEAQPGLGSTTHPGEADAEEPQDDFADAAKE